MKLYTGFIFVLNLILVVPGKQVHSLELQYQTVPEYMSHFSSEVIPGARHHYILEEWTIRNGLPINHVNQVYQTPDGFLWLATFNGLIRFDGIRFKEYNTGNSTGLPSNRIIALHGGEGNDFWLITEQSDLLLFKNNKFHSFPAIPASRNYDILAESDITWIGTPQGLFVYTAGKVTEFRPRIFENKQIRSLLRNSDGSLWVLADANNVYKVLTDFDFETIVKHQLPFESSILFEDSQQRVWFGRNRIGYYDKSLNFEEIYLDPAYLANWNRQQPFIQDFKEFDNDLILSTDSGLFKIEKSKKILPVKLSESQSFKSIAVANGAGVTACPDQSVWHVSGNEVFKNGTRMFKTLLNADTIYCDNEENIWLTIERNGLQRYQYSMFKNITLDDYNNNFYGVYIDKNGGLWAGDMTTSLFYLNSDDSQKQFELYKDWGFTAAFAETSDGRFWAGSNFCRPENRSLKSGCLKFEPFTALKGKNIFSIKENSRGEIWFGTPDGVYVKSNVKQDSFNKIGDNFNAPVRYFIEHSDSSMWMATNGSGVVHYKAGEIIRYNSRNGLSSDNIRALYEDEDGFVWAASEDKGLSRIDPETGTVAVVNINNGLYSNGIHTMVADAHGKVWMSSNTGIFSASFKQLKEVAEKKRERVTSHVFTESDGMLNREANGGFQNASFKTEKGKILFVTQYGITIVNPSEIKPQLDIPTVIIEEAVSVSDNLEIQNTPLNVNSDSKNITIKFNCPVFSAPEKMTFNYMMEGFDENWINAGNNREAVYTNLPGGTYRFLVRAVYNNEVSIDSETAMAVIIPYNFYETFWFPVTLGLVLMTFIGAGYKIRMNHLLKREQELEDLVKERTSELQSEKRLTEKQAEELRLLNQEKNRFFTNISHEFRTPLTLTIGPLEDLIDGMHGNLTAGGRQQVELSLNNARRLFRLVGQLLDLARLEDKKFSLNLINGNLSEYIRIISEPFKTAAKRNKINFDVCLPEEEVIAEFDQDNFDKIIANLLSNAFKFTKEGGSVKLILEKKGSEAVISIEDTGIGIELHHLPNLFDRFYQAEKSEKHPGSGIGLSLAKELTEMHGGKIGVQSKPGSGSTFTVIMPLSAAAKETIPAGNELKREEHSGESILNKSAGKHVIVPQSDESSDAEKQSILIVDDHPDIRLYLKNHLANQYRVIESSSGNQAVKLIKKDIPDLIISDVMMTDGDGFELLKTIREDPETYFLPVILLTAKTEAEDKLAGLKIGADDYITKPFNVNELCARITSLFEKQMRLKKWLKKELMDVDKIHADPINVQSDNQQFLQKLKNVIQLNLVDENFTVEILADKMNQSRSNLHRRISSLTDETPSSMIRRLRLESAAQLLAQGAGTVSEVAYSCGFKSIAHFSRIFRDHYNMTPTQYAGKFGMSD